MISATEFLCVIMESIKNTWFWFLIWPATFAWIGSGLPETDFIADVSVGIIVSIFIFIGYVQCMCDAMRKYNRENPE